MILATFQNVVRRWTGRVDGREWPFVALLAALVVAAWASLWWWGRSPYARFLAHDGQTLQDDAAALWLFVAAWLLMTTAMMLPTTLPLVTLFRRLVGRRSDRLVLMTLLTSGYTSLWLGFGVAAYVGDEVLHELVDRVRLVSEQPWLIGSALLLAAGLYQFSPLKERCLTACRQPLSLITRHWTGGDSRRQAWRIGAIHGLTCVGCCWPLMLLMFAVGAANLGLMLALAVIMAAEKSTSWGRRITAPVGAALLLAGISVAALRVPLS